MTVQPEELLEIANRVLKLLNVKGYSKLELMYVMKVQDVWRISFTYEPYSSVIKKAGSFKVNAESGEIEGMWLNRVWP